MGSQEPALMLLNDEFKDEDLLSKKRASEKLDIVAKVLGPEKSRRILVPWLSEHLEQSDEILFIFAKKCSELVDLVGGKDWSATLIPVLEILLGAEETVVRDAALASCTKLLQELESSASTNAATEALVRMSGNEWFTSRLSFCGLVGTALNSSHFSANNLKSLKEGFFGLCKDETPMVRRAAATALPRVLDALSSQEIIDEIIPAFAKLSQDPQESVSILWVANIGDITAQLSPDLNIEHTLSHIQKLAKDRSWRVRLTICNSLDKMVSGMGPTSSSKCLLPIFLELLHDLEGEVRASAASHLETFFMTLDLSEVMSTLFPVLEELLDGDSQRSVKLTVVKGFMGEKLLKTLGAEKVVSKLLPLLHKVLKDSQGASETRLLILEKCNALIVCAGRQAVRDQWADEFLNLYEKSKDHNGGSENSGVGVNGDEVEHPQWRLRVAILRAMENLYGNEEMQQFATIWAAALSDDICEVRMIAARLLGSMCVPGHSVGMDVVSSLFIPKLVAFFQASVDKFSRRTVFVEAVKSLMQHQEAFDKFFVGGPLMEPFCRCLEDKVSNVRLAAINAIASSKNSSIRQVFAKQINEMVNDSDMDVQNVAQECVSDSLL